MIPGHEAAGIVIEAGKGQTRYMAGDHMAIAPDVHCGRCYYCERGLYNLCDQIRFIGVTPELPGALAEKLVLTGEILANGIVHRMPEGMSFAAGSLRSRVAPCWPLMRGRGRVLAIRWLSWVQGRSAVCTSSSPRREVLALSFRSPVLYAAGWRSDAARTQLSIRPLRTWRHACDR